MIFLLVMVNLAIGVLPAWHPGWGALLTWGVALGASVLFFGSVLAHELSHALVGRRFGVPVRRITLFIFGGMAHMEREPPSPKSELLMAAAGPVTSLVIGFVAMVAGSWALTDELAMLGDPMLAMAHAGPLTTLLLWLGPVNILLGLFNLVPGFPLDGGRVLRAALWAGTRNLEKATRWASWAGQAVGWILIALGITALLSRGLFQGLWLMLIGWFLLNAARASYLQTVVHESLRGTRVADLMRRRVVTVPSNLPVNVLVSDFLMAVDQQCFPVVDDERLAGLVCIDDVRRVPRDAWLETPVAEIMTPASAIEPLPADAPATEALRKLELSDRDIDQVPVVEPDGTLLGLVRRQDILRWLRLHGPGEPLPA